jgi:lambda family phage portal protein
VSIKAWIVERLGGRMPRTASSRADVLGMDAGRVGRGDPDFVPQALGVNTRNARYLDLSRRRIIAMIDSVPTLNGARDRLRQNIVGDSGIWPQPNTGLPELDKKLSDYWWAVADGVDPSREDPVAVSQGEWFNTLFAAGEAMEYNATVDAFRGYKRGPAIELIDSAARVDLAMDSNGPLPGGGRVVQGVEFDSLGRRLAYHVYDEDPTDSPFGFTLAKVGGPGVKRIPAEDACLGFSKRWMKQVRGVPWPVSIVTTMRLEDSFKEAEILLRKVMAAVGVAIEGVTGNVAPNAAGGLTDQDGKPIQNLFPGMIGRLPIGAKLHTIGNTTPGPGLNATVELLQRCEAAGLGMDYETFTGDRTKSTFSAGRSGALETRKTYREGQALVWMRHTRGFYERRITWGVLSGEIKLKARERKLFEERFHLFRNVIVIAPGWEWVDPYKEAQADELAIRSGVKTLSMVCAGQGKHWQDVVDQRLQEEKYIAEQRKRLGLPAATPAAGPGSGDTGGKPKEEKEDERGEPEPPSDSGDEDEGDDSAATLRLRRQA